MSLSQNKNAEEVEHLLRNAALRDELDPLRDESLTCVDTRRLPTPVENDFLESMLAWERAPTLPISRWFQPELRLPHPGDLSPEQMSSLLWNVVDKLFEQRIVLDFTDHLSDRELYCLVYRDILSAVEKKIEDSRNYLHWDCAHVSDDPEVWLRYYASDEDRENWAEETGQWLPPQEPLPNRRDIPKAPL